MHARSAVIEMSPDKLDASIRQFEEDALPRYRETEGYKGFTMLVNRETGKAFGVSFWETEDGIQASSDFSAEARANLADTGGGSSQSYDVWEVAIDEQK